MSFPFRFIPSIALLFSLKAGAMSSAVDLPGAYKSAVEKTEAVQVEKAKVTQAEEFQNEATGAIFPQFALSGKYTRQDTAAAAAGGNAAFTRPDQYSVSLGVTQALFHGLSDFAEMRRRDVLVRARRANEERNLQTLYRDVAAKYYAVLSAERELDNLKSLRDQSNRQVAEVRKRVKIGRSRRGDLFSTESQAAALEAQIEEAEHQKVEARESLRLATLLPLDVALSEPGGKLPGEPAPLEKLLGEVRKRSDLQALELSRQAADESVAVARGGHFPAVDASANYYLTRTGVLANSKWDFGVAVTVPIFHGGSTQAAVREAIEVRKQAELELAFAEREAETEVRTAHGRLVSLVGQMKLLKRAAELAEENYKIQTADYRLGLVTNIEVLTAMNTFQQNKRILDKTYYETWASLAALEAAVGKNPL